MKNIKLIHKTDKNTEKCLLRKTYLLMSIEFHVNLTSFLN